MRNILMFTMLLFVCGNCNAVILIDQNTRNGSFETGQWDPWGSGNALVNDVSFASNGSYYAKLETITGRDGIGQRNFSIDKNAGPIFAFSVDVRNGINPFDKLDISVSGRTYNGEYIYGVEYNRFEIPAEASNTWVTITGTETFNVADWQELDINTLVFSIGFSKTNWVSGELLQGFLDNIVLTQIPEPASCLIMTISGLCVILRRRKW
ncbi:MAG: hypothetical protein A2Y10_00925 [Planctomycetes bacterium GWF2_41_51]|nr:MAG: hypothetical protein A2Y10_00925 [Planctomycetes bacterium GWF2_41_51]HBG26507.1 hypothetical protein [Phycisphaerales bacterium]